MYLCICIKHKINDTWNFIFNFYLNLCLRHVTTLLILYKHFQVDSNMGSWARRVFLSILNWSGHFISHSSKRIWLAQRPSKEDTNYPSGLDTEDWSLPDPLIRNSPSSQLFLRCLRSPVTQTLKKCEPIWFFVASVPAHGFVEWVVDEFQVLTLYVSLYAPLMLMTLVPVLKSKPLFGKYVLKFLSNPGNLCLIPILKCSQYYYDRMQQGASTNHIHCLGLDGDLAQV